MRAILILAVIALLMGLAGWLTLGHDPGRTTINIETDEIKRDTESAVENAEEMIDSGVRALNESGDTADTPISTDPVQPAPVDADQEPIKTVPTESPVTSPVVTQ